MQSFATIVDTHAILNVIWASLLAGVGGTAAFSVAIVGTTRFADLRREGRSVEAGLYAVVGAAGLAIVLGAVVFGIYEIVNK